MTILVTGATGLVGARLLPRLVALGEHCRALMRGGKQAPAGVTTFDGELLEPGSLVSAVRGISAVIHLAAVFRTPDTELIWKANLEGTRNLIDAMKQHAPDARFIMASTAHVYDKDSDHPGREDDACAPEHAYPASKLAAENELRSSGLTWTILRFPFVYGDSDGHLEAMPKLTTEARWHPAQKMSMVHHRDIAQAVSLALRGTMDSRVVNLADDAPTSIYELARLVGEPVEASSSPLANPWYLHVDGSLARTLGFQPTVRSVYQAMQDGLM
jgi:nucleoside-diphosphate-sugar epimerase